MEPVQGRSQKQTIDGASVLVTGGTGSFGQAFVRHILEKHKPARVIVYSRDELKQYEMAQSIKRPELRYFIGDVRDRERLERAVQGVQYVVHAAALKQVPAAEYNPIECIKTNIIGAENVINACLNHKVSRVVALSTDKAVNPVNLYGATKLCSDKLFVAGNHLSTPGGTRFSVVRYGNVIGSRGSVVPLLKSLAHTGKFPITDLRMTRFWIQIQHGAAFVDRCLQMMRGGEVFVPKLPSMRITDLASAISPTCKLEVIGIRPGEKLHELMITRDDARHTLEYQRFFIIRPTIQMWGGDTESVYEGEKGEPVAEGFEYSSDTNHQWMNADDLKAII